MKPGRLKDPEYNLEYQFQHGAFIVIKLTISDLRVLRI
jgi:hypothetical protein